MGEMLETLCIWECNNINAAALVHIGGGRCPNLASLNVTKLAGSQKDWDAGFAAIAAGCPKLKHLNLQGGHPSDSALIHVAEACHELESLSLDSVHPGDPALVALGKGCRALKTLRLYSQSAWYSRFLTDVGIQAVAAGCPLLEVLGLRGCGNMTDVSAKALAAGCSRLSELSLVDCLKITDVGLVALATGCRQFKKLVIFDSYHYIAEKLSMPPGVTEAGLSSFAKGVIRRDMVEWYRD